MKGKTVLVTGGNSGIGKAAATALVKSGAEVIIACRSAERGDRAVREISELTGSKLIKTMLLDLADLENVRKFAAQFNKQYNCLDVLVNNAGVMNGPRRESRDGYELHFAVNHLGHFLLTALLFEKIRASGKGRIINVSSVGHRDGRINFDNLMLKKSYGPYKAYCQSKLANVLFTYSLAEKTKNLGIMVNCVHPGVVATPIILNKRDNTSGHFLMRLEKLLFRSPEKGAETIVALACGGSFDGKTGLYWVDGKAKKSSRRSYDKNTAERLWKISEELVRQRFDIPQSSISMPS